MPRSPYYRALLPAAGIGGGLTSLPSAAGADAAAHAKYRPDIDGLRAVAVLPVLLFHLGFGLAPGGFVGVDIFFVISGYLITGLISAEMHEGTYSITKFYVRRARRIFPALFFMCAVTALLVLLFCLPSDAKRFSNALAAATLFGSNIYFYLTADYFAAAAETQPLLHTWSLAVEEHFYLMLPLLFWVVTSSAKRSRSSLQPILYVAAALTVVVFAVRIINWRRMPIYTHADHLTATHLRFDSLMFGVVLAYAFYLHPEKFAAIFSRWRVPFLPIGAACFIPAFVWPLGTNAFVHTAGFTLFQLGAGMLVVAALLLPAPTGYLPRLLARLGAYSYSIYLWHLAVIIHLMPALRLPLPFPIRFAVTFVVAMLVGVVLAKIIEMPALRLRDHWVPSRAGPMPVPHEPPTAATVEDADRVAV